MMIRTLDSDINYVINGLINDKFHDKWGVAVVFDEDIHVQLKQNFFKNNYHKIFLFQFFSEKILVKDEINYIGKIFFNFFINNEKLEKANIFALNYFGDISPQMILNFLPGLITTPEEKIIISNNEGFVLNIQCYTDDGSTLENYVDLSLKETHQYLKIILPMGKLIYDVMSENIFSYI